MSSDPNGSEQFAMTNLTTPAVFNIFVAHPSDVEEEFRRVSKVVDELQPVAAINNLALKILHWTNVLPSAGRPEEVILEQLRPETWDVFVGIMWCRFGTPPGRPAHSQERFGSGTEEEFKTALKRWNESRRPQIFFYRCLRLPPDKADARQFTRVSEFFADFDAAGQHPGLYRSFRGADEFETLFRKHLTDLILRKREDGSEPPVPVIKDAVPRPCENLILLEGVIGPSRQAYLFYRSFMYTVFTIGILTMATGLILWLQGRTGLPPLFAGVFLIAGTFLPAGPMFKHQSTLSLLITARRVCENARREHSLRSDHFCHESVQIALSKLGGPHGG